MFYINYLSYNLSFIKEGNDNIKQENKYIY